MVQRDDTLGGSRSAAPSPSTSDLESPNATSSFGTEPGAAGSYGTVGAPPEPHRTEGTGHSAREQVRSLASEVRDQAKRKGSEARDQVGQMVGQQKTRAAERLTGLAGALRQAAGNLQTDESMGIGRVADNAAGQIDRLAGYLRDRELGALVHDVENMARRHPDVFLGATFLSGLLLARFLKSTADRDDQGEEAYTGTYGAGSYDTGYGTGSYGTGTYASGAYEAGTYGTGAVSYGTGTAGSSATEGTGGAGSSPGGTWGTQGGTAGGSGAWGREAETAGGSGTGTLGSPVSTLENATVSTGTYNNPTYDTAFDSPQDATGPGRPGKQRGGA